MATVSTAVWRRIAVRRRTAAGPTWPSIPRPAPWRPSPRLRARSASSAPRKLRSEEHTSELQSLRHLVCRLLLLKNSSSFNAIELQARPWRIRERVLTKPGRSRGPRLDVGKEHAQHDESGSRSSLFFFFKMQRTYNLTLFPYASPFPH